MYTDDGTSGKEFECDSGIKNPLHSMHSLKILAWWFQNMYSWAHVSWRFWNIYLSHIKDELKSCQCHSLYALQLQQKNMWYVLPCYPPLKCRYTWAFIGRLISNFGVISRTPGSHHLRDNRTPPSYIIYLCVLRPMKPNAAEFTTHETKVLQKRFNRKW